MSTGNSKGEDEDVNMESTFINALAFTTLPGGSLKALGLYQVKEDRGLHNPGSIPSTIRQRTGIKHPVEVELVYFVMP